MRKKVIFQISIFITLLKNDDMWFLLDDASLLHYQFLQAT